MEDKDSAQNESTPRIVGSPKSKLPAISGVNKGLIIISIVFVFILAWQIYDLSKKPDLFDLDINQTNQNQPTPYLTESPTVPLTPILRLYDTNNQEKPINQLFFESVKKQLPPNEPLTSEGLYQGKVIRIEKDDNNTYLVMQNYLSNGYGKTIWFQINNEELSKTKIVKEINNKQIPATFADIKTNSVLDINENVDYAKDFENRIINLTIIIKYTLK